ncbi:hypothetical protein CXB51_006645 [Gossypium anomalum]|uniref:DUF7745 domain-containing protein n=1 Tax=Gossypium anomalum TaxID=47600 RepID=A0A8J5ZLG0_9ROSI|nr:hypothetical protein CXB51_006645 [Gossypium anomalum]
MPNLRPFSSHQNKCTGGTPLAFCIFTFYTRGLGLHHIKKVLTKDRLPKNGFLMEELIIPTTEKNAVVRDWSLKTQKEKGDSLVEGCIANLPEYITVNVRQNNLEDLVWIWNQWDSDTRGIFAERYGDIANLIAINVDECLIQAMIRFWDPAYQCFTFNQEDMTPTIEEYAALLRVDNVQPYKIYVKEPKPMTFKKKLMRLTDMTDTWAEKQIKKKNETICIPWSSLRDLVLNHPDMLKRVNLFALAIYGLVIFPKVLRHLEVAVVDFFERLKQGINPLLNVWILSHFWKVERTPFQMFSKTFSPLEAYLKKEWPKEVTEQHWVSVFQNLRAEDVTQRAPWIRPSVLLYKVGDQDWVPLLGLWGGVGYAPLLVQRQFSSRQFIPATRGLAQSEFAFAGEGYMKRVRDTAKSWKKIHLMELALYADTLTQDYDLWRKQWAKMSRDLSVLQEENYQLKIDVQIERSRTEKVQKEAEVKGKAKKEEEKVARATIELSKKNAECEAMPAEVMTNRSKRQELKERIRDLEGMLQDCQQQLDTLLNDLEEKDNQYDRDVHAIEEGLQEKEM